MNWLLKKSLSLTLSKRSQVQVQRVDRQADGHFSFGSKLIKTAPNNFSKNLTIMPNVQSVMS